MPQQTSPLQALPAGDTAKQLVQRIGVLTRQMREGMRELGYIKEIARVTQAIPDALDRLSYVAQTTERAAERVLNAVDIAQPIQSALSKQAKVLNQQWDSCVKTDLTLDDARQLIADTRSYLTEVPEKVGTTQTQLLEIMMAQDFQDLTGQVLQKMMCLIRDLETQLLQLLVDNVPAEGRQDTGANVLDGPQIKPGKAEVPVDQNEVDDLLASLGF